MIKVTVLEDSVEIQGHALPDVCAAVSSVMYTTINILARIDEKCVTFKDYLESEEKEDKVVIKLLKHDHIIDIIYDNMINMFEDIESAHNDNVKLLYKGR